MMIRSIRVSNKAFQSKVAGVPGGAELLVAAGYEYRAIPEQGQEQEQEELYLVHSMDAEGRVRLRYTLGR